MVCERDYPEHISNKREAIQTPNTVVFTSRRFSCTAGSVDLPPEQTHNRVCFPLLKALEINFEPIK